jgi:hypothetical protein
MCGKTIIVKHIIIAFLLLLIGSIDFLNRNLLTSDYHPLISLLFVIAAIIAFIYVSHRWYRVPYEHVSSKIHEYYKDTIDDIAMTKDNSYLSNHTQVNNLEDLINHYKSAQKE